MNMNKVRWVIQNNLIAENELKEIQNTCKSIGVEYEEVLVIPFSSELPQFTIDEKENIYYGSTTFMNNIYKLLDKPKGLFYDHETFLMSNYIDKWGEYMLNCDAQVLTIKEFINSNKAPDDNIFIRPNGDGKEFDGQVIKFNEAVSFLNRTLRYESDLTENSKILSGPAYNINKEWRLYIVNGDIVSSSRYCENFRLSKSSIDIPDTMLEFARQRIKEYTPHDKFAMDIASTDDGTYYIIECGCLNSVGFYHSNIEEIIKSITNNI
jgi:hypothetical protein